MPWFVFRGINAHGVEVSGEEFGNSEKEIAAKLISSGISIIKIAQKQDSWISLDFEKLLGRVSRKELRFFYLNLATLINAGCALRSSLSSLAEQTENQYFRKVLNNITASIEAGKSLSDSLKEHPHIFPPLFVHLVKAGEEGGMLDQILVRFSNLIEKQEKIRSKVRSALVLPALMLFVAGGVVTGLMYYVIPNFMRLFKGKEALMPYPTKVLTTISNFVVREINVLMGKEGWFVPFTRIAIILLLVYLIIVFLRTKYGYRLFCETQLRIPLFGNLFKKAAIASFMRTLGSLLKGGVPALQALKITKETIANVVVRDAVEEIYKTVEKGGTFAESMYQNKFLFPKMVVLMIQVGETSGKTDEMLEKVSDYYDSEVDEAISALVSAIEPLLTVVMGGIVLFIALALFLPLFNIGKLLK